MPRHFSRNAKPNGRTGREATPAGPSPLRIIGGRFRGRKLRYAGDPRTRPMKDRVREAMFNLLGPDVRGTHALDLFAGTGALGLEALSRGAARATFFERHFPTAAVIEENIGILDVGEVSEVKAGDTFVFLRRTIEWGGMPWLVFCSPPYDLYVSRTDELVQLIGRLWDAAPEGSLLAVEADERFDFRRLPAAESWDVRAYSPAVLGIFRVRPAEVNRSAEMPERGLRKG